MSLARDHPSEEEKSRQHIPAPAKGWRRLVSLRVRLALLFSLLFVLATMAMKAVDILGVPGLPMEGRLQTLRMRAFEKLTLIADIKDRALTEWLEEHDLDGRAITTNSLINDEILELLEKFHARDAPVLSAEHLTLLTESAEHSTVRSALRRTLDTFSDFDSVELIEPRSRRVLVSTEDGRIGAESNDDFIIDRVRLTRRGFISDAHLSSHGHAVFDLSHPIMDKAGQIIAVAIFEVNMERAFRPILDVGRDLGPDGEAYLVGRDGLLLTFVEHALPDGSRPVPLRHHLSSKAALLAADGQEGMIQTRDYRGQPVLAAFRHIRANAEWGWGLLIEYDQDALFAPLEQEIRRSLLITAIGVVMMVGLTVLLARRITTPVAHLGEVSRRLAAGDLTARASLPGHDELAELAAAFDSMAASVEASHADLIRSNEDLRREIIERRRAERGLAARGAALENSNAELQQFAYVASHDLQEPLNLISGYLDLLASTYKGQLGEDADEFIDYTKEGVTRMKGVIQNLLAYSRIGTKGSPFTPTDLGEVAHGVLHDLGPRIRDASATVLVGPLPTLEVDGSQIARLFQNLIGNALKYRAADTPPRVQLTAEERRHSWVFAVSDNGIGIDPAHFEKVFLIFQRLHARHEFPGDGVGLAICKRIVDRHGGRIWIESALGKGSTFHFTLPKERGEISHDSEFSPVVKAPLTE